MRGKHVIDKEWDLKKFITFVRETYRISWKEIYWKVWSYLYIFKCERCSEYFPIAEMGNCSFHSEKPIAKYSVNSSGKVFEFPCCKLEMNVQGMIDGSGKQNVGCKMQMHEANAGWGMNKMKEQRVMQRAHIHQLIVLENPPPIPVEELKTKQTKLDDKTPQSKES